MIEIRTLNLEIKTLEYQKEFDFDTSENFIETYSKIDTDLNHLFIIHPPALDELNKIIDLLNGKNGNFFLIILSSDAKRLTDYKADNIWNISEGICTENNKREEFNTFYQEIKKIKNVSDTKEIKKLIKIYLDPYVELDPKTEQDIAYIKLWQSMNQANINWQELDRFKNDKKIIKKIEYWLKELS